MPLSLRLPATGPASLPVAPPAATLVVEQPERIAGKRIGDGHAGGGVGTVVRRHDRVGHGRAGDLGRGAISLGDRDIGLRRRRDGMVLDLAVGARPVNDRPPAVAKRKRATVFRFVVAVAGTGKDRLLAPATSATLTKIASPAVVQLPSPLKSSQALSTPGALTRSR